MTSVARFNLLKLYPLVVWLQPKIIYNEAILATSLCSKKVSHWHNRMKVHKYLDVRPIPTGVQGIGYQYSPMLVHEPELAEKFVYGLKMNKNSVQTNL